MLFSRQVNFFLTPISIAAIAVILIISSCTVPRRYQKGKPFVYRSNVTLLNTDLSTSEKQLLKQGLLNQMDDSLKVRKVLAVRLIPPFFLLPFSAAGCI